MQGTRWDKLASKQYFISSYKDVSMTIAGIPHKSD